MSSCRWVTTPSWLFGSLRPFLYSSIQTSYSCHLFVIFSAIVRSLLSLSFIEPFFAWHVPFVSLNFMKRSLVFPILLFSSMFLHWSLRKDSLSLLAILWNSAFSWEYLSLSTFPFAYLLFSVICKASSDNYFTFLYFFIFGMVLVSYSCKTSIHSSSGTVSAPSNPLNIHCIIIRDMI